MTVGQWIVLSTNSWRDLDEKDVKQKMMFRKENKASIFDIQHFRMLVVLHTLYVRRKLQWKFDFENYLLIIQTKRMKTQEFTHNKWTEKYILICMSHITCYCYISNLIFLIETIQVCIASKQNIAANKKLIWQKC